MRIVVVCQYYTPEPFKIGSICEGLVDQGHTVTVLTGLPNYPSGRVPKEFRGWRRRHETLNGVEVVRVFEVRRRARSMGLAMNYLSYVISGSARALTMCLDADIVFVYQLSPVTMAVPGLILKHRLKIPMYLYLLDIWPESMKTMMPREGVAYRMVDMVSRWIYRSCDHLGVTSAPFVEYLTNRHGVPRERISVLPQHSDEIAIVDDHRRAESTNVFFIGNMGIAQDLDCVIAAARICSDVQGLRIHFVGDGSRYAHVEEAIGEMGLEGRLVLHGRHPWDTLPYFYSMADACVLSLRSRDLTGLTVPGKLQEYMSAGKMIIAAADGPTRTIIEEAQCGVCVNAGDAEGLAVVLRSLVDRPEQYSECGLNARAYYETHFTREVFLSRLVSELAALSAR